MADKAKCTNCGKDMAQTNSANRALYCTDEPCKKAFIDNMRMISVHHINE